MKCKVNAPKNEKKEKNENIGKVEEAQKSPICDPSMCCRPSLKDILPACYANKICSLVTAIVFPFTIVALLLVLADALFNYIDCLEDNVLDSEKPCSPPRQINLLNKSEKFSLKEIFYMALTLGIKVDKKKLERPICQQVVDDKDCEDNANRKSEGTQLNRLNKNLEKIVYFCWKKTDKLVCRRATKEEEERMAVLNKKQCIKTKISSSQTENEKENEQKNCKDANKETKETDKIKTETAPKPKDERGEPEIKDQEAQKKTKMEKDVVTLKMKDSSSSSTKSPSSSRSTSGSSSSFPHEKVRDDALRREIKKIEEKVMTDSDLGLPLGMVNIIALIIILLTMML